ncbi:MAG: ATP-dependent Clp protease adaptor ClpS [Verrucomicrobiales bacterium]
MTENAVESPVRDPRTQQVTQTDDPWQVIVLDDPVNLMEYVTRMLIRIFGFSREVAEKKMMEVHNQGRSVVWAGGKEKAEMYVQELHRAQLKALIEKSS